MLATEVFYDKTSNMLVYDLHGDDRILAYAALTQRLANGYVALPRTLYNLQVLRAFNLPVPPAVDSNNYSWPIMRPFRPRDHQRVMTNFMVLNPRCFNLSDMGTMKTLATLWAADYVMEQNPGWRTIIVCPKSITQRVWGDAITTHLLGKRTFCILDGSSARRQELLQSHVDFYIVNFDGVCVGAKVDARGKITLGGLSLGISQRKDIAIVVVDEASAYRAGNTRRHRVARLTLVPKPYFWALTGTPVSTGPENAHGLTKLIRPDYPESFTAYKKRVMYQIGPWKWVPKPGAHIEAMKLLQPSIRFEMRDCTDVPPCTEQMRDVELTDEQKGLYRKLKREMAIELKGRTITAAHEAALRLKLIQLSCGCIYDANHTVTPVDCSTRLQETRAVIEEAGRKVIIFAPLTSVVDMLCDELSKDYTVAKINGAVPMKKRNEIFKAFQDEEEPRILVADPGTMSHGLDLFAASVVLWYGATDRTELYLQANRRIDRPGQTVPTTIVQLASTPIEREIFRRAANNQSMQGLILDLIKDDKNA